MEQPDDSLLPDYVLWLYYRTKALAMHPNGPF